MSQVDLFTGAKLQCQCGVTVLTDVEAASATMVFFSLVSICSLGAGGPAVAA